MEKVRKHIIFHGDVQGVGFRWRAKYAAGSLGITGWVRNCSDGTVEMEAEGFTRDIDEMIITISKGHFIEITHADEKTIPVCGGYGFEVR